MSKRPQDLVQDDQHANAVRDSQNPSKYVQVNTPAAPCIPQESVLCCSLPPHQPVEFESLDEYEIHYNQQHVNRCFTCHRNFPTEHYLGLHIAENHDPINESKKAMGEKIVNYI